MQLFKQLWARSRFVHVVEDLGLNTLEAIADLVLHSLDGWTAFVFQPKAMGSVHLPPGGALLRVFLCCRRGRRRISVLEYGVCHVEGEEGVGVLKSVILSRSTARLSFSQCGQLESASVASTWA